MRNKIYLIIFIILSIAIIYFGYKYRIALVNSDKIPFWLKVILV